MPADEDAMEIILELDCVTKRFGERAAVDDLSLRIGAGEIYALLGPNGAGKTTTLNMILGFLAPDAGGVSVDGFDVARDPMRARAAIAYLPETVMLNPTLSGIENLRYFALLCGRRVDASTARTEDDCQRADVRAEPLGALLSGCRSHFFGFVLVVSPCACARDVGWTSRE